jgi:UDP-N-acetylmuramoyl-tripeptide--D-alanyl-D-alanine ligase
MSMGTLAMVAESVGGTLYGADCSFESVTTDTREMTDGQLFFALRGERFDAAGFVQEAARRGAAGAVVERRQDCSLAQVEVSDTRSALGRLAQAWRSRFSIPVVAVTGSNGKTTVKEMLAAILRAGAAREDEVLVTRGNLNNEIGLPMTVLKLRDSHRWAVLEMGASHRGDIAYLADIAQPDVGVVTNAAAAHLEGFGSLADVAATKGEILERLPSDGVAIINQDDRFCGFWLSLCRAGTIVSFGLAEESDFRAVDIQEIELADAPALSFQLLCPAGRTNIRLPMAGRHNVRNALAASAAAVAVGAGLDTLARGLEVLQNIPGRLRRVPSPHGVTIYDDSYNANPASVKEAISFLAERDGETWLVLGDMAELGPASEALHREIGETARAAGVTRLFCVGEQARAAASAFGAGSTWYPALTSLAEDMRAELQPGVVILVKGSRCMGLEKLVAAIAATNAEVTS